MAKEVFEKEKSKIFITITLYLLLAFAFFSDYWMSSSVGPLIFIFGILTLIPLTIIYLKANEDNIIWAWFWMIPLISLILFNLTLLYEKELGINSVGKIIHAESIWATILLMMLFWIVMKIIKIKKSKK